MGKSSFSTLVFFLLALQRRKVVHVAQAGRALVHEPGEGPADGVIQYMRLEEADMWREKDCWLLLDGRAREIPFLEKKTRGIVFASPKKENYHEFVKQGGRMLIMPPWSWEEVKNFAKKKANTESDKFFIPEWHYDSMKVFVFHI